MGEHAPKPPLTIPNYYRGQQRAFKPKAKKVKGGYQPTESPRIEDIQPPPLDSEKLPRQLPDGTTLRGYRWNGKPIISRPVGREEARKVLDRVGFWGQELIEKGRRADEENHKKAVEELKRKQARANWYGTTIKPSNELTVGQWAQWAEEVLRIEGFKEERATRPRERDLVDLAFKSFWAIASLVIISGVIIKSCGG